MTGIESGTETTCMEHPLVSVIIPVYKVEPYLRQCMDSVLAQTYTNLEVILVDDGSPDGCPAICDEYAKNDARVRVIHKENGGLSDARNAGIRAATGEWICFVDSDDIVQVQFIEFLLSSAMENSCDIAICNYRRFSDEKKVKPNVKMHSPLSNVINPEEAFKRQYKGEVARYVVAWNKIYRRKIFTSGIYYPKGKLHEDDFTTYKCFLKAKRIVVISPALIFYRIRKDSITSTFSEKRINDFITAHVESLHLIRKYNDDNFLAEALYTLFISYFRLLNSNTFDTASFVAIKNELFTLKRNLCLRHKIKFRLMVIKLLFYGEIND